MLAEDTVSRKKTGH